MIVMVLSRLPVSSLQFSISFVYCYKNFSISINRVLLPHSITMDSMVYWINSQVLHISLKECHRVTWIYPPSHISSHLCDPPTNLQIHHIMKFCGFVRTIMDKLVILSSKLCIEMHKPVSAQALSVKLNFQNEHISITITKSRYRPSPASLRYLQTLSHSLPALPWLHSPVNHFSCFSNLYKWNHTVCTLSYLACFAQHMFVKFISVNVYTNGLFSLLYSFNLSILFE